MKGPYKGKGAPLSMMLVIMIVLVVMMNKKEKLSKERKK